MAAATVLAVFILIGLIDSLHYRPPLPAEPGKKTSYAVEVRSLLGEALVFEMKTGFGFFPAEALANQVGLPTGDGVVPRLLERVRPLHEVVKVDHYLQGCPPSADEIHAFLTALLDGRLEDLRNEKRFG